MNRGSSLSLVSNCLRTIRLAPYLLLYYLSPEVECGGLREDKNYQLFFFFLLLHPEKGEKEQQFALCTCLFARFRSAQVAMTE